MKPVRWAQASATAKDQQPFMLQKQGTIKWHSPLFCKPGRSSIYLGLVLSFVLLSACKTTTDAAAAAKQLNTVATNLAAYYTELSTQLDDTVELNELQSVIYKIPFTDGDRAQIIDVKNEILKRATMAHCLADLATAYGNLAGSKANADASTAASALATQLASAKAIPQGSAIPAAVGDAAQLLVTFMQSRDLKKGSQAVSKAVSAVSDLFDGEKKAYESIENQRLALARQIADKLVDSHEIEMDFPALMSPATKPFSLKPKDKDLSGDADYAQLMKKEIDYQVADQEQQYVSLTDNLSASLHDVRTAVNKVVAG
jgi:hypothetical protein